MSTFPLKLTWSGTTVTKAYDREALAEAPGKEPIRLSAGDEALGGDLSLWNPEDTLGASLSMCHMLTFLALAAKVGIDVRRYDGDAVVELGTVERVTQVTTIRLTPTILVAAGTDLAKAAEMFEKAHKYCFIANSLKSAVVMEPVFVLSEA